MTTSATTNPEATATIKTKKNGAVVFFAIVLLLVTLVLGVRVGNYLYLESLDASSYALENAAMLGYARYEQAKIDNASHKRQVSIEAIIGVGTLLAGAVLLSFRSHMCSECGSKVGLTTAKICGHCGTRFTKQK